MKTTDVQQTAAEETHEAEIRRLMVQRVHLQAERERLLDEIKGINAEQSEVDRRLYEIASHSRH